MALSKQKDTGMQENCAWYVKPPLETYTCIVCQNYLSAPVLQILCGHRCCTPCRITHIQTGVSMSCPGGDDECRTVDFTKKEHVFSDFGATRELRKGLVYCQFKTFGCNKQIPLEELDSHLVVCEYNFSATKSTAFSQCVLRGKVWSEPDINELVTLDGMKNMFAQLCKQLTLHTKTISRLDARLRSVQNTSAIGQIEWKIPHINELFREADSSRKPIIIQSDPFHAMSTHSYSLCGFTTLIGNNGDENESRKMRIHLGIIRSKEDVCFPWPFRQRYTLSLLDQHQSSVDNHKSVTVVPDTKWDSVQKPTRELNIITEPDSFLQIDQSELEPHSRFVLNDSLLINVRVDQRLPLPVQEPPACILDYDSLTQMENLNSLTR